MPPMNNTAALPAMYPQPVAVSATTATTPAATTAEEEKSATPLASAPPTLNRFGAGDDGDDGDNGDDDDDAPPAYDDAMCSQPKL